MEKQQSEQWAIVELFGHTRIAGVMSECSIGGCSFLRIDVPGREDCPGYTKLYGNGAIYAITLTDEETGRAAAEHLAPKPMSQWSAREMLKLNMADQDENDYRDDDNGEDDCPL